MADFRIIVDTGLNGGAVSYVNGLPHNVFRFQKNSEHTGVQLEPFVNFLRAYKSSTKTTEIVIEDPANVDRASAVISTQYFIVGQIWTTARLVLGKEPFMLSANQWINWVKAELGRKDLAKDPKARSRLFAEKHYPEFLKKNYPHPKRPPPDAITDCLAMGEYLKYEEEKIFSKMG